MPNMENHASDASDSRPPVVNHQSRKSPKNSQLATGCRVALRFDHLFVPGVEAGISVFNVNR